MLSTRALWVLRRLSAPESTAAAPIRAGVLAQESGVTIKTIRRDVAALRDAGVAVVTTAGRGGGWHLDTDHYHGPSPADHVVRILVDADLVEFLPQGPTVVTSIRGMDRNGNLIVDLAGPMSPAVRQLVAALGASTIAPSRGAARRPRTLVTDRVAELPRPRSRAQPAAAAATASGE